MPPKKRGSGAATAEEHGAGSGEPDMLAPPESKDYGFPPSDSQNNAPPRKRGSGATVGEEDGAGSGEPDMLPPTETKEYGFPPSDSQDNAPPAVRHSMPSEARK
ncbi:MAG TPA: hypothetical protein VMK12_15615 [Anaeromyxobacteraceae bacterium]|nr:hypothetical protein [Anaeromyxobacteraceae bacterium]